MNIPPAHSTITRAACCATEAAEWLRANPAREEALHLCFMENPLFNRLRARERESCYEKWLPVVAARTRQSPL